MMRTIDFHAHILPDADHGSSGLSMTLEQLALLKKAGVDTVVATPHFYPNRHTVDYLTRKIECSLEEILEADADRPKIALGAEVLYCEQMENLEDLDNLCIRGTNILLLELPLDVWDENLFSTVRKLLKKYTVVLAHIDRYIDFQQNEIAELLDMGALAQINAASLFSISTRKRLLPFIMDEQISALGTDLHRVDKKTVKRFSEAYKKLGIEYEPIMERTNELIKDAILY